MWCLCRSVVGIVAAYGNGNIIITYFINNILLDDSTAIVVLTDNLYFLLTGSRNIIGIADYIVGTCYRTRQSGVCDGNTRFFGTSVIGHTGI